jgi:hypothetical protein
MSGTGGGLYTTWPWRFHDTEPESSDKTPSGLTRNEVEWQELEVLAGLVRAGVEVQVICVRMDA